MGDIHQTNMLVTLLVLLIVLSLCGRSQESSSEQIKSWTSTFFTTSPTSGESIVDVALYKNDTFIIGVLSDTQQMYGNISELPANGFIARLNDTGIVKIAPLGIIGLNHNFASIVVDGERVFLSFSFFCKSNTTTDCEVFMGDNRTTVPRDEAHVVIAEFDTSLNYVASQILSNMRIFAYHLAVTNDSLYLSTQTRCIDGFENVAPLENSTCIEDLLFVKLFRLNKSLDSLDVIWSKNYFSTSYCIPGGLVVDNEENYIYFSFNCKSNATIQPYSYQLCVIKMDTLGCGVWNVTTISKESRTTTGLSLGSTHLFVAGVFVGAEPYGDRTSVSMTGYFSAMNKTNGNLIWSKTFLGPVHQRSKWYVIIAAGPDNTAYVSAVIVNSTNTGNATDVAYALDNPFSSLVVKINSTGDTQFYQLTTSNEGTGFNALAVDNERNSLVLVGGYNFDSNYGGLMGLLNYIPNCGNGCGVGKCIHDGECLYPMCYLVLSTNNSVCSGNGDCEYDNHCNCTFGFSGDNCELADDNLSIEIISNSTKENACMNLQFSSMITNGSLVTLDRIEWIITQNEDLLDSYNFTSFFDNTFRPNISKLHQGVYTVAVSVFGHNGDLSISNTTVLTRSASCVICNDTTSEDCRYRVLIGGIGDRTMDRMHKFEVELMDSDLASGNSGNTSISGLVFEWDYLIDPKATNMLVTSSNISRFLSIVPVDTRIGMRPNITVTITLRVQAPQSLLYSIISFDLKTTPSIDFTPVGKTLFSITPQSGSSLQDVFRFEATNWTASESLLVYSFSYRDIFTGSYIRLGESTIPSFLTTLPVGNTSTFDLSIKLTVFSLSSGNYGFAHTMITVLPSYQKGLLTQKLEEAVTSGNYTLTLAVASQIRSISSAQIKENYDELKEVVSRILTLTNSNVQTQNLDPISVEQQFLVVDMVTKNTDIVSNGDKEVALEIMRTVIDAAQKKHNFSEPLISSPGYQNVANVISNVANKGFTNQTVAGLAVKTAEDLAKLILSLKTIGEPPTVVVSDNFELTIMIDTAYNLANVSVKSNQKGINTFQIPYQFGNDTGHDAIGYSLLVFAENPYRWTSDGVSDAVSSPIIDIKFKQLNGTVIQVENLQAPLVIMFNKSKAEAQGACPEAVFECRYWSESEQQWKTDGCYWINSDIEGQIACACNHTTSFSAFVLEKGDSCVAYAGIKITDIVFNTIYLVLCVPLLIGLFVVRNQQPIRSRFIAPYLGIIAIIVDSVLQGWLRNSLSLSKQQEASDAFSYVIMLTANPLFITALFVFLWQQIRFLLLQNIYSLMPTPASSFQKKFIQINKMLASKTIFSLVAATVSAFVFSYFAILVGFASHYNNGKSMRNRKTIVTVQAISFAGMLVLISLGIIASLILDIVYSMKTKFVAKRSLSEQEDDLVVHIKKTKAVGVFKKLFDDDPLLFRTEAVIIAVTTLIIILLYSIGIATVFIEPKPKSAIMIVRTIIGILLMFARVIAFGGFVFAASLRSMISKQSSVYKDLSSSAKSTSNASATDQQVLEILRSPMGYTIVFNYCQKEFSLENLLLWKDLDYIRAQNLLMSTDERKHILDRILELYINNRSIRQLNISNQSRQVFLNVSKLPSPSVSESEDAFAMLYGVCVMNIADTLTRLSNTEQYRAFIAAKATSSELRDDFSD